MKNDKINLEELQVESFVTSLGWEEQDAHKGGTTGPCALASAIGATISAATAVTALSYDITHDASWWNCADEDS